MEKDKDLAFMKSVFGKKKVWILAELLSKMKVAAITIRRKLKAAGALTSYNKNGKYYTLPHVPSFNDLGLWEYHDIRFSKYGNLKKTMIGLISDSDAGLSADKLGDYLSCGPHFLLHQLTTKDAIYREKLNGRYIYFSIDSSRRGQQLERYKALQQQKVQYKMPASIAVQLLIEKLKRPTDTVSMLVKTLQAENININEDQVNHFLEKHGLEKKGRI